MSNVGIDPGPHGGKSKTLSIWPQNQKKEWSLLEFVCDTYVTDDYNNVGGHIRRVALLLTLSHAHFVIRRSAGVNLICQM